MRGRHTEGKRHATRGDQKVAKTVEGCEMEACESGESDESDESDESGDEWRSAKLESTLIDFEGSDLVFKRRCWNAKACCCP